MLSRKEMKKQARRSLKKHYFMYVAVCLIAAYLGAEFSSSLNGLNSYMPGISYEVKLDTDVPTGVLTPQKGLSDVLADALKGDAESGRKKAEALEQQAREAASQGNPALGRSRGVFAQAVNALTSGSLYVTAISAVNSIVGSPDITRRFLILGSMLLTFLLWFFLRNMFRVVSRRIFLEGRCYEKLPIQRFLFLLRVKKWTKVSWTMFVTGVFQMLWSLTIIGGIIKTYSYYLVPFIAAENPDMGARETITLSRRMMKGHKWECFVFDLTFIGWYVLGLLTLGLTDLLFSSPYKVAAFSEYYVCLRQQARDQQLPGAEALNDRFLYELADLSTIASVYGDVLEVMSEPVETMEDFKGIRGFMIRWFGILIFNTRKEKAYEKSQAEQLRYRSLKEAVAGNVYPGRLFPIPEVQKRIRMENIHYMRNYSVGSLVMMFFIFSMFGWIWEVSLHLVTYGEFVNRGVLHGPWLPIYGSGGILILTVLKRLRDNPVLEFLGTMVLCGVVEYFTAYYLEMTHDGQRWWDYSGYFLNLHGRICAEGLLVFGVGGVMIVYVLAPMLDNQIKKLRSRSVTTVCATLLCLFVADQIYSSQMPNSGEGVTSEAEELADTRLDESAMDDVGAPAAISRMAAEAAAGTCRRAAG